MFDFVDVKPKSVLLRQQCERQSRGFPRVILVTPLSRQNADETPSDDSDDDLRVC